MLAHHGDHEDEDDRVPDDGALGKLYCEDCGLQGNQLRHMALSIQSAKKFQRGNMYVVTPFWKVTT